jgi:hypothetical protein
MTLLIALSNDSYAIVLGDRRLTSDGKIVDDEANKVCALFCDDARVVIAFTGLAGINSIKTQDWLRDNLVQIGNRHNSFDEILTEFQSRASTYFSKAPKKYRATAFLFSGFRYDSEPRSVCLLISNFGENASDAAEQFSLSELSEPDSVNVSFKGYTTAVNSTDKTSLETMLAANNSPPKVLWKAVEIARRVAKDKRSRNVVGGQYNSGVVFRQPNTAVTGTYHSLRDSFTAYGPDAVVAVSTCHASWTGSKLTTGLILTGRPIRQHDECWCGSGKRFKSCHLQKFGSFYAKLPGFNKPMYLTFGSTSKTLYPSGSVFCVQSGFV